MERSPLPFRLQGPGYGSGKTASLAGADFSNATFSETDFASMDLTGAKFKVPANFSGAHWITLLYGITCPDGAPPGGGVQNYRACRIGTIKLSCRSPKPIRSPDRVAVAPYPL
jgi:hypothetical protein